MYKVFIADDEIYVLSLIDRLIDWERMNLTLVGTADNGLSAFEQIQRLRPDIVIVDVKMPGIDGISLMQKVRALDERVHFIIISGHKRFEYAKSAMKYNVEDYILKPINKDELVSILSRITEKLTAERDAEHAQKSSVHQLGASTQSLNRVFLEQYLSGRIPPDELSMDEVNAKYFLNFRSGAFRFVIIQLGSREEALDRSFVETMMSLLSGHFTELFKDICYAVVSCAKAQTITALVNYDPAREGAFQAGLRRYHDRIREILLKFEKLYTNEYLGLRVGQLEDIGRSLSAAELAQQSRITLGIDRVIDSDTVAHDAKCIEEVFGDKHIQALEAAIRSLDAGKIRLQIMDLFARAETHKSRENAIFHLTAAEILMQFSRFVQQIDLKQADAALQQRCFQKFSSMCAAPGEMAQVVSQEIENYMKEHMGEGRGGEHRAVRIARRHIAENYASPISLSTIAGIVNISPIYFSVIFKKEAGVNFLDYLNKQRIEKSKELLKQTSLNIQEVSLAVGFQDQRYYAKMFRKLVGVTPTEYRNFHAK